MSKADESRKASEEKVLQKETESHQRVSGEPESNLAAVGGGGIAGAAAGAVVGTAVGGPVGGAIGAAVGAVTGAAAADQIQDKLDPKLEEVYWQENYRNQSYYRSGDLYESYLPAYKFGWESAMNREYANRDFQEIEAELKNEWIGKHSDRDWTSDRQIIHDAFIRIRQRGL